MKHRYSLWISALMATALGLGLLAYGWQPSRAAGVTIYVDAEAAGADDGSSWADAFSDLQDALDAAQSGDQVWVAAGTYLPNVEYGGTGDRYQSFQVKNGVAIYGGFVGTESLLEQRDWAANPTILSGDLNGDDGPDYANMEDNSYHVFYHQAALSLGSSAVLDGFTVSGGNANGISVPNGGGMYNEGSSPTLSNVTFTSNMALIAAGGMYNIDGSSPVLTNVTFSGNHAQSGGGMFNWESNPALSGVTFASNSAEWIGGGMYNDHSNPILTGVTFTDNSADFGGGMYNSSSDPMLTEVAFSANTAVNGGGMYSENDSNPSLFDVSFYQNFATSDGGGMCNKYWSNPTLTRVSFIANLAGFGGGISNHETSAMLRNVIFVGNQAVYEGGGIYNEYSHPMLYNVTLAGNYGLGGGLYNNQSNPTLYNNILWGNVPDQVLNGDSRPIIYFSDIQDGCPIDAECSVVIDLDPQFVRAPSQGGDGQWGTADDDYGDLRLQLTSPAIDAGVNSVVPLDVTTDLLGLPRFVDIPSVPDTGFGTSPLVDMGAYEAQVVVVYLALLFR